MVVMVHFSPKSTSYYFRENLYDNRASGILFNQTSELKLQFEENKLLQITKRSISGLITCQHCLLVTLKIRLRFVDNNCFFLFFLCVVESSRWRPTNTALIVAFSNIHRHQFEGAQRVKRTDRNIEA